MSKKAEKSLPKYVIPQKQSKASSLASSLTWLGASQLEKEPLQLTMIDVAPFQYLTRQKDVEVFAISIQDINYQLDKDKKPSTDSATRVSECYHNFFDVFSKETPNTMSAHSKHSHVIRLLGENNHGQAALKPISNERLIFIKKFLEDNLKKTLLKQAAHFAPCQLC